jgi:O-antigen ligase
LAPRLKAGLIGASVVVALVAFALRFEGYFQRGATSVVARFEYWRVAVAVAADRPLWGSGPGTFEAVFRERKRPGAEMTRLVHNDYLQQASDSGIVGGVLFAGWIFGGVGWVARARWRDPWAFAVWLGLLGWCLQGWVEFGLYVPAVAWPAMALLGALVGGGAVRPGNIAVDRIRGAPLGSGHL